MFCMDSAPAHMCSPVSLLDSAPVSVPARRQHPCLTCLMAEGPEIGTHIAMGAAGQLLQVDVAEPMGDSMELPPQDV